MQYEVAHHILLLMVLMQTTSIKGFWPQTHTNTSCIDQCLKRGTNYYWCHTDGGKGLCAPFKNMSSSIFACKWDSPCSFAPPLNKSMKCVVAAGGTDYCAPNRYVGPHSISTTYELFCNDACIPRGYNYYWCNTAKGWDYCSPRRDTTLRGTSCSDDHYCAKHGQDYFWCRTINSWDYCGPVVDCAYWPADDGPENKRDCTVFSGDREVRFEYKTDVTIDRVRYHWLNEEVLLLIHDWSYDKVHRNSLRGTLLKRGKLRFDQGFTEGRNLTVVLIQKYGNITEHSATGFTVAKVLFPTDTTLSPLIIRRALLNSYNRRECVTLNICSGGKCSVKLFR